MLGGECFRWHIMYELVAMISLSIHPSLLRGRGAQPPDPEFLLAFLICSFIIVQIFYKHCSKLYALDPTLDLKNPAKAKLEEALKSHIIEKTEYVGTFAAKSA